MATFLVTYAQEDLDRLLTFGPFSSRFAAATFAWGIRHAHVRELNRRLGGYEAGSGDINEIERTGVASFKLHGNELVETYFRIDEVMDPGSYDPAHFVEDVL